MIRKIKDEPSALKPQQFLESYEEFFQPLADRPITLLELGVHQGGSLLQWRAFFPRGIIAGLDVQPIPPFEGQQGVHIYQGRQEDTELLDRIAKDVAPGGFDIIIDDCSHIAELTRASFWHLFEQHLKPGGIYVIEDWGTGFWSSWPDGQRYDGSNHSAGMVGFVKELVDECGRSDMTDPFVPASETHPPAHSRFAGIRISLGQVFVVKAGTNNTTPRGTSGSMDGR